MVRSRPSSEGHPIRPGPIRSMRPASKGDRRQTSRKGQLPVTAPPILQVLSNVERLRTARDQFVDQRGEHSIQNSKSLTQEQVNVLSLRNTGSRRRALRKVVAIEDDHAPEMIRQHAFVIRNR
jgi:hypothetical protein